MNQYSELLYFIKGLAEAHELVNTVTNTKPDELDLDKANIYPLFHIYISTAQFTNGQTIAFDIVLTCLNNRDMNKEVIEDKFWRQDNEVDNHNETLAILNDIWLRIKRDWNDTEISSSENVTLEKVEFEKGNILDGWSLPFRVEMPNTTISLC